MGFVLLPFCLLIRFFRRLLAKIFPRKHHGILIIKFLGAGNYVALQNFIAGKEVEILSARSNRNALEKFGIGKKHYLIDDRSFISLVVTSVVSCIQIALRDYEQVVNLETESNFAKFVAALTSCKILSGVSNVHKSYIDYYLYDRYLVNPTLLSKADSMRLLVNFSELENLHIKQTISSHRQNFIDAGFLTHINQVIISPTSSNTDSSRRLSCSDWEKIFSMLWATDDSLWIEVLFPSKNDEQFMDLSTIIQRYPKIELVVTSYDEFVEKISKADLILTVDSQALHIAQQFERPTVAFFGPTSPFGVNFCNTTYAITKSLACSPCFHKYLKLPCDGTIPCMRFDSSDFEILRLINHAKF